MSVKEMLHGQESTLERLIKSSKYGGTWGRNLMAKAHEIITQRSWVRVFHGSQ